MFHKTGKCSETANIFWKKLSYLKTSKTFNKKAKRNKRSKTKIVSS